jgi:hypothetical protein
MVDTMTANFKAVPVESAKIGFREIAGPTDPTRAGKEDSWQFVLDQHRGSNVDVATVAVVECGHDLDTR